MHVLDINDDHDIIKSCVIVHILDILPDIQSTDLLNIYCSGSWFYPISNL